MNRIIGPSFGAELIAAGHRDGVSFTVGGTHADIQVDGIPLPAATGDRAASIEAIVAAHDPAKPDPTPDPIGFAGACKAALGGIVAMTSPALSKYATLFYGAVTSQNWADVAALILDAKATGALTAQQYAGIQQLAAAHNIPLTLP